VECVFLSIEISVLWGFIGGVSCRGRLVRPAMPDNADVLEKRLFIL
jgi:hypothetical protein